MERAVIWNHVANDWTQSICGKGDRSEIARFIYYSQKDTFKHDPLLRGPNSDGFMGWHAERSLLQTIKSAFTVNLPTKYPCNISNCCGATKCRVVQRRRAHGIRRPGCEIFTPDGRLVNSCRSEKPQSRPVDNLTFCPGILTRRRRFTIGTTERRQHLGFACELERGEIRAVVSPDRPRPRF